MKTIKKSDAIKRVSDDVATIKVKTEGWNYISKEEWKNSVRDVVKIETEKKKTEYDEQEMKRSVEKPRKEQVTNQTKKRKRKGRL